MTLSFVIPGRPVPKGRPRVVGKGKSRHAFTPKRTRDYEKCVAVHAQMAIADAWKAQGQWDRSKVCDVTLTFYGANPLADLDNLCKSLLDGMQGSIFADDRQVCNLTVRRLPKDSQGARTHVLVEANS